MDISHTMEIEPLNTEEHIKTLPKKRERKDL